MLYRVSTFGVVIDCIAEQTISSNPGLSNGLQAHIETQNAHAEIVYQYNRYIIVLLGQNWKHVRVKKSLPLLK